MLDKRERSYEADDLRALAEAKAILEAERWRFIDEAADRIQKDDWQNRYLGLDTDLATGLDREFARQQERHFPDFEKIKAACKIAGQVILSKIKAD